MGNQQKAAKGDTVMATTTRLSSTPVVVLSSILGRTPNLEEYKTAVQGIDLTKFAPPVTEMVAAM